jgi:hypothetical protein
MKNKLYEFFNRFFSEKTEFIFVVSLLIASIIYVIIQFQRL